MPKEFGRNCRFAELIKRELSLLIQRQYPINAYGIITITAVEVSLDLRSACIFITCLTDGSDSTDSADVLLDLLNKRTDFFRTQIARTLFSKRVPTIKFKYDKSIARGMQVFSQLLNSSTLAK